MYCSKMGKQQWPLQVVSALLHFCDAKFPQTVRSTAASSLGALVEEEYIVELLKHNGLHTLLCVGDAPKAELADSIDIMFESLNDPYSTVVNLLMHPEQGARLDFLA